MWKGFGETMGNSYNALLFPQSSPFMSCFSYYELTSHINCKSNNKQDWASLDTFTLHPSLLQLCSGPTLYGMLLAGALCCPLSAVPLTGPLVKRRESFFHPDITSACPSVWATLEGVQCPWRPPLSSSFPSKLWQSNPFFGVVSYCLMPLWDKRSAKWANSARWAWWPRPPRVKQLH